MSGRVFKNSSGFGFIQNVGSVSGNFLKILGFGLKEQKIANLKAKNRKLKFKKNNFRVSGISINVGSGFQKILRVGFRVEKSRVSDIGFRVTRRNPVTNYKTNLY
jgi:hypothetical protein